MEQPHISVVLSKFNSVLRRKTTREDAAAWAMGILSNEKATIENWWTWDLILLLAGIDARSGCVTPSEYLYDKGYIEAQVKECVCRYLNNQ